MYNLFFFKTFVFYIKHAFILMKLIYFLFYRTLYKSNLVYGLELKAELDQNL